jgi:hypothetical protein
MQPEISGPPAGPLSGLTPAPAVSPDVEPVPVLRGAAVTVPVPTGLPQFPALPSGLPEIAQTRDDKVTRDVCHALHLSEPLESFVHHQIVNPRTRAVCPAYGIDLVAVARHAAVARDRRILVTRVVRCIRIVIVLAVILGIAQVILSAGSHGGPDVTPAAVAAAVIVLCVMGVWGTLFWYVRAGRASALQVLSGPRPLDQAPAVDPVTEDRLDEVNRANAVVYAYGQGDPFIGSGRKLFTWNTDPIDVTRAAADASQAGSAVVPFNEIDLHQYLETEIPRLGFNELQVSNRLYVRGDYARFVGGLQPDLRAVPGSVVDARWLASGIMYPSDQARTYVCVERIQMGGDLVTCMYVRARIEQGLLTLDGLIYLLPPLAGIWLPTRSLTARGRGQAFRAAFGAASRETIPALRRRAARLPRKDTFRDASREEAALMRRELKDGHPHDYGAIVSLREALASYQPTHYFEITDVVESSKRLLQRQMNCILQFLEDHKIDTSSLREQAAKITQNISYTAGNSYSVGAVHGGTNIIGSHGAVNNISPPGAQGRQ